jgi:exosortase H (IPTLxxWG-CTERM-specific)
VGKPRRQSTKSGPTGPVRAKDGARGGAASGRSGGGPPAKRKRGWRSWYEANRSDLKFLLIFGVCLVVYYVLTLTPPVKERFFPSYLRLNAQASAALLSVFGEEASAEDRSIISAKGPAIELERGCDAVEPSALFVSAVLASPVPLLSRLVAAGIGTALLMVLNLVRIITLYLFRVYYPSLFDTMHLDVWQALFIILALVLWAVWASRASRRRETVVDAPP